MSDALFGLGKVQVVLWWVFNLAILALAVWALADCLSRPARAFPQAGKRTHGFWLAVTGVGVLIAILALPTGWMPSFFQFLGLVAAVAAIVYLVDVRPAVAPYSRRRGRGGGSGGSRGGW